MAQRQNRRYWRLYRTQAGNRIIRDQLAALDDATYANVVGAMEEVVELGIGVSSKLRGEIREIDAQGPDRRTYRLLFAKDGHVGQMLLGVVLFEKRTQKTPPRQIDLAHERLADWRRRRKEDEAKQMASGKDETGRVRRRRARRPS